MMPIALAIAHSSRHRIKNYGVGLLAGLVEAEYQFVLKEAEELRQYYEEQNRDLIARIAAKPPRPGTEAIRAKLRAERTKLESQA